jgi:hypothetical protein
MKHSNVTIFMSLFIIYFIIKIIPYGNYILYPINIIVTFLHEFWHAFWAIITWWKVVSIQVNTDGSWLAITSGWIASIILMWWYIWSAIFWNTLLYYAMTGKEKIAEYITIFLGILMIFVSIFWFSNMKTFFILFFIWWGLIYISKKNKYDKIFLWFLWLACLFTIIDDFKVGPSSDLAKFSEIFVFIPQTVWMYIWLFIVVIITFINLKIILKKK